ncbi:MAG: 50S ribosomal protein L11 methyltransferase [Pseudomonadota bacterium]
MALLPPGLGLPERKVLEERDWVAHALEGLGVVRAGPFVLFGSHDAAKVQDEDGIKLQIEANQAFGTGHHPTTAGCLEALGNLPMQPNNILDLGCGSGVLAMASRCLWPEASVTATDIDGQSIKIAQENAKINGLDSITFDIASGTQSVPIQEMAPFDLIIANILAGPLKELAPDIVAVAAQPCFILLAGLLDEQQASVIEVYRNLGFQLTAATGTPRWPILTLSTQKE